MEDDGPVVVFIKMVNCPGCNQITMVQKAIDIELRKVDPNVRIIEYVIENPGARIPEYMPDDILDFSPTVPTIIAMRKDVWNLAVQGRSLRTYSDYVEIMNYIWDGRGSFRHNAKEKIEYSLVSPLHYNRWLTKCIKSGEKYKNKLERAENLTDRILANVPMSPPTDSGEGEVKRCSLPRLLERRY